MKNFACSIFAFAVAFAVCGCESVEDDARETPIGSVISGETRSPDRYLQRVSERNRTLERDAWRPEQRDF